MSELRYVATDEAPEAIGPYSQAVVVGDLVFCSGQIAIDPATGELLEGDVVTQTDRVIRNLRAVLDEAGSSLADVVKTTVFLADMGDYRAMNEIYANYFGDHPPARAAVEASGLPKGVAVEIEAVARVG